MKFLSFLLIISALSIGTAGEAASTSGTSSHSYRPSGGVQLNFSGGLVTVGGAYGGTFLTGVSLPVARQSPVRLGLDSGVMFSGGVALPILLSIIYSPYDYQSVKPYIAGTVGPVIGLSRGTKDVYGFQVPDLAIGDGIKLAILVRPGLKFQLTELLDLNVETALGGLTGIFYISPSLGISLRV